MAVERIETPGNFCLTSLLLVCSIEVSRPEQRAVYPSQAKLENDFVATWVALADSVNILCSIFGITRL